MLILASGPALVIGSGFRIAGLWPMWSAGEPFGGVIWCQLSVEGADTILAVSDRGSGLILK